MRTKVKPSEQLSKTIEQILYGDQPTDNLVGELLRLGAERILQEATEAEVDEFLGRGWYERRDNEALAPRGYRNGYTPLTIKTTQGPLRIQRPRVRDCEQGFLSSILARIDRLEEGLIGRVPVHAGQ
jgi:putative transposase